MSKPFVKATGDRVKITNQQRKQIRRLYSEASNDLKDRIKFLSTRENVSSILQRQYLREIQVDLEDKMQQIDSSTGRIIQSSMRQVCRSVVEDNNKFLKQIGFNPSGTANYYIPTDVVSDVITGKLYSGKWSLSQSIWGDDKRKIKEIDSVIAKGIVEQKSAYEIAKDLERYVNPSARKDWDWSKVYPGTRRVIDYNAQRLARTMVSHAYQESFVRVTKENPFVEKYRWLASNSDRTCQLCMDRDGQLFDKDNLPLDHPNGMCTFEAVIPDLKDVANSLADWVNGEGDQDLNKQIDNFAEDLFQQGKTNIDVQRTLLVTQEIRNLVNNRNTNPQSKASSEGILEGSELYIVKTGKSFKDTGIILSDSVDRIDKNILNQTTNTIALLNNKYPAIKGYLGKSGCQFEATKDEAYGIMSALTTIKHSTPTISKFVFADTQANEKIYSSLRMMSKFVISKQKKGFYMPGSLEKSVSYLQTHEYGHIVQNYLISKNVDFSKCKTAVELRDLYNDSCRQMFNDLKNHGIKKGIIVDEFEAMTQLSGYAMKRIGQGVYSDAFAESFANMECGKPNAWGKTMESYLKKEGITK